ncbi:lantibiotic dehydratase [Pedobacter sp. Leaf250]|uniref:lantibiotic dehydratase n=1 Tax=Pedobacter sp. Leaf250 TaxID=2876559 RepID=UPI001E5B01DE|nr:lantibiotic dehydratase [Pedobacter sp. Leaf250]
MKPHIHPSIIFRTPKFSYQADLEDSWDELKKAISISSTAFYETIKDVEAKDLKNLSPKIYFTVWKYFNRAKYRSTPYGTFASFSFLADAFQETSKKITVREEQIVHQFVDWPYRNKLNFDFEEWIGRNGQLFCNSSYYLTHNSIRYIACTNAVFELAEIDRNDFVMEILSACAKPIAINNLIDKLELNEAGKAELLELLQDMHSLQLIFTDRDPNIIGEDYFERIGIESSNLPKYLIAERKVIDGGLDEHLLKPIPGLIDLLSKTLKSDNRKALKSFISRFNSKFDQQEVPLSIALDPEMGVGYDELEQAGEDDFVAQFNAGKKNDEEKESLKSVLKNQLSTSAFKNMEPVYLNKLAFETNEKESTLPNTFSLLMWVVDDLLCVDQIGGVTANALTGRFSIADKAVEGYCKEISAIEQNANPEMLFFDVAYMVETDVDNINRRKLVYDHQLSILNFDTSIAPLLLSDIQISVRNHEVVLRSKKLNKRLIPRMASAYNYTRSDLSVFRLLCDLQHQGLQTSLSLTLDSIFPDLDFYPRFQYHHVVLSAAKWRVKKAHFLLDKEVISIDECRLFLNKLGVSKYFKTGLSDQTLCFNLDRDEDLNAFLQYMQKQSQLYLEEVIMPIDSVVADQNQKPYLTQFILNLYHNNPIYTKFESSSENLDAVQQLFLPGQEWLYFEIYCHQQRSDELLVGVIPAFLNQFASKIKSWFFIRYNEHGNHLRFRVLLHDNSNGQELVSVFGNYLQDYIFSGLISDLQLKSYKRELERYGADMIVNVEDHFSADSNFVISLLQYGTAAFAKYKWCSKIVDELLKAGVFDSEVMVKVIKMVSDSFNKEHHLNATDFKKLNQQYQQYKNTPFEIEENESFNIFKQSFIQLLNLTEGNRKVKLFTDLMHMHVNRLFSKDQRTNEMVMYYFLLKDIQRKRAIG